METGLIVILKICFLINFKKKKLIFTDPDIANLV